MAHASGPETMLLEILGPQLLAFVLNESPETLRSSLEDGDFSPLGQAEQLAELVQFLDEVRQSDSRSLQLALAVLGNHNPQLGASWATHAHLKAGGTISLPEPQDDLSESLVGMVRDSYPLFLLPRTDDSFAFRGPEVTSPLYRHPDRERFEAAVMADPVLSELFSSDSETTGRHGTIHRSTGTGGNIQLAMFAEGLLRSGWELALLNEDAPSMRQHAEAVLKTLRVAQDAIAGMEVTIPALVGVAGLQIAGFEVLELPWGRLRAATPTDESRLPPGLAGKLATTTSDGKQIEIDYAGDLVMELEVPYKVALGEQNNLSEWPVELSSAEIVAHHLETLSLALHLAWEGGGSRPVIVGTWRTFLDPLETFGRGMAWNDPRRLPSLVPWELTGPQVKAWQEWIARVDAQRVSSIDIAVRRTLLAAVERADPTDALVDAVIAWENLFGAHEGEQTLRISAALAWLIADNGAERRELRARIVRLYGLRSRIVHGATTLDPREAYSERTQALNIAIEALQVLFRDRPDLLADCRDSAERSLRLILDAP